MVECPSDHGDHLPAGTIFGPYTIGDLLGSALVSEVYEARTADGAVVAIKVLKGGAPRHAKREARLGQEGLALADVVRMRHRSVGSEWYVRRAGVMARRARRNGDASTSPGCDHAASLNLVALGHGFGGVICTLGVKIGSDFDNDCAYIVFRKDDDGVDVG